RMDKIIQIFLSLIILSNILLSNTLNLTKDEKIWLENNPMVKVAVMDYWNHDGDGNTIHTDYLKLLNRYSDINIIPIRYSAWKDGYNQIINKKDNNIHGIMNLSWSKQREKKYFLYTKAYNYEPNYLIVRKSNTNISNLQELKSKTVLVKEKAITLNIVNEISDDIKIKQVKLDTLMYKQLFEDKDIDAFVTYNKNEELLQKYNLKVVKIIYDKFSEVSIGIDKQYPHLRSIINKIYKIIPKDELSNLRNKVYSDTSLYKSELSFQNTIYLTQEEKEYIKNNTVKIGVEQWVPILFSNDGSDIDGICGDFTKLIIRSTGLKTTIVTDEWVELLKGIENKTIDLLPDVFRTPKREEYGLFSEGFLKIKDAIYFKDTNNDIYSLKDLEGKVLAMQEGNGNIDKIRNKFPTINIIFTKDLEDSINRVLNGEANAFYAGQIAVETKINNELIKGLKSTSIKTFKAPDIHFFSKLDEPLLASILQKGLQSITYKQRNDIFNKWLNRANDITDISILNNVEKEYLLKKQEIKMCIDPDWMPFEKIENKKHIGLASDYIKLISQKIKIPIKLVETSSWAQSLQKAKDRECDILSLAANTKSRRVYMDFTTPYIMAPIIVATKVGVPFVDNLESIMDKKLGVVKGYALHETLKEEYPSINLIEVKSIKDGLDKVSSGEIFGYLDNSIVLNYEIQRNYISTISVSGSFVQKFELNIATRNDEPILNQIFQKAISSIDQVNKQRILNKWANVSYASKIDYRLVWQILTIVFIVGVFIIYRQILLKKQNQKLEDSINVFEALLDSALEGIIIFDTTFNCIDANNKSLEIFGFKDKRDAISENMFNFVTKDSVPILQKYMSENNTEPCEVEFLRKSGEEFPALVRGKTIILNGKPVRVSAILDMTDIKNKEKLLIESKHKAEEANRIKSQFLANMSHEIRTPINGIVGMTHLMRQTYLDDKQANYIHIIEISSTNLLNIINNILDFSKIEAEKLKIEKIDFNLKELVANISSIVSFKAKEKNIVLEILYDKDIEDHLFGDSLRISQVLINLINNA
ncbi:MAG: transporter substrate-binding domain-containing protein, partial [Arcobacteraceae bacterium]|nr:transporter substrate-binding domain-containing protein [Arcobacteraceae bacterium]